MILRILHNHFNNSSNPNKNNAVWDMLEKQIILIKQIISIKQIVLIK